VTPQAKAFRVNATLKQIFKEFLKSNKGQLLLKEASA